MISDYSSSVNNQGKRVDTRLTDVKDDRGKRGMWNISSISYQIWNCQLLYTPYMFFVPNEGLNSPLSYSVSTSPPVGYAQ